MSALPPARCSIYGCRSNPRYGRKVKFFPFPSLESPMFATWLDVCKASAERILSQSDPIICSKHFYKKAIHDEQLVKSAVPLLFLKAPPGYQEEEEKEEKIDPKRFDKVKEKSRLRKLVYDVAFEWIKRARAHANMAEASTFVKDLRQVGERARDLLGATLKFAIEGYFVSRFRRLYLPHVRDEDCRGLDHKSLDVKDILLELSPYEKVTSERMIANFRRRENEKLQAKRKRQRQGKKSRARHDDNSLPAMTEIKSEDDSTEGSMDDDEGGDCFQEAEQIVKEEIMIDGDQVVSQSVDPKEDSPAISTGGGEVCQKIKTEVVNDVGVSEQVVKKEVLIDSCQLALRHLKPIEDFALRQENYRVIGALSAVEMLLKNPKEE